MKDALLNQSATTPEVATAWAPQAPLSPYTVFFCPEESHFYAQCLEKMVLASCAAAETIIEFGAGDGSAVISSLLKSSFQGVIHGYELSSTACQVARSHIHQYELNNRYIIHNQCFFAGSQGTQATTLIANPPYLPAPDDRILMPELYGGRDGAAITNTLLTVGCPKVMLMIAAFANPVATIHHAHAHGYYVADFMVTPLPFGYYSSEPKVQHWIAHLRSQKKAFYSPQVYFLSGVLFAKHDPNVTDLSDEFLRIITAL